MLAETVASVANTSSSSANVGPTLTLASAGAATTSIVHSASRRGMRRRGMGSSFSWTMALKPPRICYDPQSEAHNHPVNDLERCQGDEARHPRERPVTGGRLPDASLFYVICAS